MSDLLAFGTEPRDAYHLLPLCNVVTTLMTLWKISHRVVQLQPLTRLNHNAHDDLVVVLKPWREGKSHDRTQFIVVNM